MTKALIFDIGGVVTHGDFPALYASFARRVGADAERIAEYHKERRSELLTGEIRFLDSLKEMGVTSDLGDEAVTALWIEEVLKGRTADESMLRLIDDLRKTYVVIALTNLTESRYFADVAMGLYDHFDHSVLSFEEGMKKPDPEFFGLALSRGGISAAEAVFIDDQERQVTAATALGIPSILFKNTEQLVEELRHKGIMR